MLATNQILQKGRYRIINSFGQDETGGMYEAYDTVSNTNVVLRENVGKLGKITTSSQLESINKAFAGSAELLKEIRHDSLVSVQDYFSEIGCQYLVLEAVTGFDLSKFTEPNDSRPSLLDVMSWADQLLAAVGYLHQLSPPVIHTDITPENVKLTSNNKVKLLTAAVATNQTSGDITAVPGQNFGNDASHYQSLEQLWSGLGTTSQRVIQNSYDEISAGLLMQPPDARSDLYSIGATFYHVLTGTKPKDALDRSITILDGSPDPLQRLDELDNSIPSEISDVLIKALEIRREDRFDSAVIMRQMLRTAMVRANKRKSEETKTDGAKTPPQVKAINADLPNEIDSSENLLELHQSMSGDRQRELLDEEARLAKEQDRIHQRRLELEAEKTLQLAEMERLELEAEYARMLVEQERKRLEKEMEAEKERGLITQRLAELEAEQVRQRAEEERLVLEAENERKRIEQRMHDIEAEKERKHQEKEAFEKEAEAERQRAAQKIAELEAEQEARRAEEERLERQAKEERIRAEERLLELEAEHEKKREEQKRFEAEAEEERKRAERRLMELSGTNLDVTSQSDDVDDVNEDDQELLELDPVAKEIEKALAAADVTDTTKKDTRESRRSPDFTISGIEEPKAPNWRAPVIAGGAVIAVIGGWMLMSSGVPETKPSTAVVKTSVQTVQAEQIPAPVEQPIAVQEKQPESDKSVTSSPAAEVTTEDRTKNTQLNTAQPKQKKPAPSTAKNSPPKKVVTVDDLINDNDN